MERPLEAEFIDDPSTWTILPPEEAKDTDGIMSVKEMARWMQWLYTDASSWTRAGFFDGLLGNSSISEMMEYKNGFNFGHELRDHFKWWVTIQEEMFPPD